MNAGARHALASGLVIGGVAALALAPRLRARFGKAPSIDQCRRMVDRYLEADARQRLAGAPAEAIARAVAAARASADHQRDVDACCRDLTSAQVDCALGAAGVDALERCLQ